MTDNGNTSAQKTTWYHPHGPSAEDIARDLVDLFWDTSELCYLLDLLAAGERKLLKERITRRTAERVLRNWLDGTEKFPQWNGVVYENSLASPCIERYLDGALGTLFFFIERMDWDTVRDLAGVLVTPIRDGILALAEEEWADSCEDEEPDWYSVWEDQRL